MKRVLPSRRDFLQQGSAALTAGCALGVFGRVAVADSPAAKQAPAGFRQAIVCSHREAGEAARDMLRQGGNAIDAAAAAMMVQFIIDPAMVGFGGYGGSLAFYQAKTGRVQTIDFDARAPRKFDPATFNETSASHGYLAVGVPGNVAGLDLALREYGALPFKTVAWPALDLAANGIPVTPRLIRFFDGLVKEIDPVSRHAYFPNGVPAEGTTWVQADLARLIRRLGDEGPGSFYTGDIAATIVRQVQAGGGVLTEDDFHDFHATVAEPLHINYRGYDLYTPPLPSAGLTSLSVLKTLEQFDLSQYEPWGPSYFELFAGASNLCWGERYEYFGDPDFVTVPVAELLSEERARKRAGTLRSDSVGRGSPDTARSGESSHTINVVVVDKDQNVVSLTATHGGDFGAHVAIEGLGLMLGHGMSRFSFESSSPNYPAGGKRPQHNMAPLVVLRGGKPYAVLGMPGGPVIVSFTAQMAISLIDFAATTRRTVAAPRIHADAKEPIEVSSDMPQAVAEELRKKGHRVDFLDRLGGEANAVVIDPQTGEVRASASGLSDGVLVF